MVEQLRCQRTRLAPTPSGYLHLGNVFSFLQTIRLAAHTGARLFLRIDDLDRERADVRYVQDVFDTLDFLGVTWEEGPRGVADFEAVWSQVHRMDLYRSALEELRQRGVLFACNCSRAQIAREAVGGVYPGTCRDKGIPLDAPEVNWRVRTDMDCSLSVRVADGKRVKTSLDASMKDFVVRKKDGYPAYQLTSIVDDLHFGVDLVVRGIDLWPSTLAQMYLAGLLAGGRVFEEALFYHHDLLKDADGGKLSKSAGATSIQYLRGQGLVPEDIYGLIGPLL